MVASGGATWIPSAYDRSGSNTPDAGKEDLVTSVHSTPSKPSPRAGGGQHHHRKTIEIGKVSAIVSNVEKQTRRVSLGQEPMVRHTHQSTFQASFFHYLFQDPPPEPSGPRKSELKRGRMIVEKNRDHAPVVVPKQQAESGNRSVVVSVGLRRNDSLTKKDKQAANARRKEEEAKEKSSSSSSSNRDNRFAVPGTTIKMLKTLANQRRIRRRHTVGGTKDFAGLERVIKRKMREDGGGDFDAWLRETVASARVTSNPDLVPPAAACLAALTTDDPASRRLSLPDTVLAEAAVTPAGVPMPALLESKV